MVGLNCEIASDRKCVSWGRGEIPFAKCEKKRIPRLGEKSFYNPRRIDSKYRNYLLHSLCVRGFLHSYAVSIRQIHVRFTHPRQRKMRISV